MAKRKEQYVGPVIYNATRGVPDHMRGKGRERIYVEIDGATADINELQKLLYREGGKLAFLLAIDFDQVLTGRRPTLSEVTSTDEKGSW